MEMLWISRNSVVKDKDLCVLVLVAGGRRQGTTHTTGRAGASKRVCCIVFAAALPCSLRQYVA